MSLHVAPIADYLWSGFNHIAIVSELLRISHVLPIDCELLWTNPQTFSK